MLIADWWWPLPSRKKYTTYTVWICPKSRDQITADKMTSLTRLSAHPRKSWLEQKRLWMPFWTHNTASITKWITRISTRERAPSMSRIKSMNVSWKSSTRSAMTLLWASKEPWKLKKQSIHQQVKEWRMKMMTHRCQRSKVATRCLKKSRDSHLEFQVISTRVNAQQI